MPSPFPGIDPFVEVVEGWSDFHARLIYVIVRRLGPLIRPRYHARIERWESTAQERQGFIQIFDKQSGNRIVTQIELLSPTNKSSKGLEQYRQKQNEVLNSRVHLVEIDLLCRGVHVLAVPEDLLPETAGFRQFLVSVNRHPRRDQHKVYRFTLRDRLPRVHIPLSAPDPDVVLDLSAVYTRVYDEALYCDTLHYQIEPPQLRLTAQERAWLDQHLREQGRR